MFSKDHLENGIPVLMDYFDTVRSVSVGIWIKAGSRYEPLEKSGISHFLEHMFFKGTAKRTTRDIAVEIDSMGGDLNAFTSRENTAFYIKIIDEYIDKGIELLSDIFVHSIFPEDEIEKEKKIVKEELKIVEDTPDDYIFDLFNRNIWGQDALGRSILGKRDTIVSFTRDDLLAHIRRYYGTRDIIISCAGNFRPASIMKTLNRRFGGLRRGSEPKIGDPPVFQYAAKVYHRELSEAHLCVGVPSLPMNSEERYTLFALNTILGAGVSSRLFQEIRENRGLAYSVFSFTSAYRDTGIFGAYAGISKKRVREVAELIIAEMMKLKDTVTPAELERAKQQLKGNLILGLESTGSRMNNIARQEIYFDRYISADETMESINMVNVDQVSGLAERLIREDAFSFVALGPLQKDIFNGIVRQKPKKADE
ncbi:MAG: pitrilysin family protein [Nitrospirota bacterium]|nr:pitrilysin family protein [Nitrospirota bacterium]